MKNTLRKSIGILLVLVMLISTLSALSFTASAVDATNLLQNGDFETGTAFYIGTAATMEVVADSSNSANSVLHAKGPGYVRQQVPVEKNTNYVFSFRTRRTDTEGSIYADIWAADGTTQLATGVENIQSKGMANMFNGRASFNSIGTDWNNIKVYFNSGDNETIYVDINLWAANRDRYFDDLYLYEAPAVGEVVNGDFNNDLLGYYGTAATMEVVADPANANNNVLHAIGGGYVRQVVNVEKNTDYIFSFRAKKADSNGAIYADILAADGTTQLVTKAENIQYPNSGFGEIYNNRISFNSDAANWNVIRAYFNSGDNETVYLNFDFWANNRNRYIDDVCIYKAPTTNVITNGDFENGYSGIIKDKWVSGEVIADPDNYGNHILKVGEINGSYWNEVKVEANTNYIWSFRAKSAAEKHGNTIVNVLPVGDDSTSLFTYFYTFDNAYSNIWNGLPYFATSNEGWATYYLAFNSGSNTSVRLWHQITEPGRVVYMDDWSLRKLPSVGEFSNAGFENGKTDYILNKVIATPDTENVHGGTQALKLEGINDGNYNQYIYKEIAVERNTDYVWSFYFDGNNAKTKLVGVTTFDGKQLVPSFLRTAGYKIAEDTTFPTLRDTGVNNWHESLFTEGWTKYSVIFNSGDNDYVRLCIDMINQDRSGVTDDWSLSKYYFTQGDANNDGTIDSLDLTSVRKILVERAPEYFKTGADYNGDGKVGLVDLVKLKKTLLHSDLTGYELVWADDFSGEYLDNTKWTRAQHMSAQDDLELRYDETGINVDNDAATLYAGRVDADSYYTNASLTTCDRVGNTHLMSFKYGYVEMRAKIPFGAPAFPSFWMKSVINNDMHGEIDIFEHFCYNGPQWIQSGIHKWYLDDSSTHIVNNSVGHINVPADGNWHTYGLLWTPEKLEFKLDGTTYHTIDISANWGSYTKYTKDDSDGTTIEADNAIFHDYYYLIMNNYLHTPAGSDNASYAANSSTDLPTEYVIDYVRLYQNSDGQIRTGAIQ